MAQLVARLVRIEKVRGSNPLSSTTFSQVRDANGSYVGFDATVRVTSGNLSYGALTVGGSRGQRLLMYPAAIGSVIPVT